MPEHQLQLFARRAERCVVLPDLDSLVHRGVVRRRRTRGIVAVLVAAAVAVAGVLLGTRLDTRAQDPIRPPEPQPAWTFRPGDGTQALEPGTYRIESDPSWTAWVTVPEHWSSWLGPVRQDDDGGEVAVLVLEVSAVTNEACQLDVADMTPVGSDPAALVQALQVLPRHRVTMAPSPDDRFGLPATHLRLEASTRARCPYREFPLFRSGDWRVESAGPHNRMDLWVVDVAGQVVLVVATTAEAATDRAREELAAVVGSIRLEPRA
jgi:hypothetical protein